MAIYLVISVLFFPIWDIVFGIFRTTSREPQATMDLGLQDVRDRRTHRLVWLLISPFIPVAALSGDRPK
ncbi:MAG: hypothetical protein AAGA75_23200 [Cyanobacteria bacterium P01_E01_bin.6]